MDPQGIWSSVTRQDRSISHILSGLSLELYVGQFSYLGGSLSQKSGARLSVHASDTHPMVDELGVDLGPGTSNSIAMRRVRGRTRSMLSI